MHSSDDFKMFFRDIRGAKEGKPSVIDSIVLIMGCSASTASKIFTRILERNNLDIYYHQFLGERQRKTPTTNWETLVEILSYLPGKEGNRIRTHASKIFSRAHSGDRSLAKRIMRDCCLLKRLMV